MSLRVETTLGADPEWKAEAPESEVIRPLPPQVTPYETLTSHAISLVRERSREAQLFDKTRVSIDQLLVLLSNAKRDERRAGIADGLIEYRYEELRPYLRSLTQLKKPYRAIVDALRKRVTPDGSNLMESQIYLGVESAASKHSLIRRYFEPHLAALATALNTSEKKTRNLVKQFAITLSVSLVPSKKPFKRMGALYCKYYKLAAGVDHGLPALKVLHKLLYDFGHYLTDEWYLMALPEQSVPLGCPRFSGITPSNLFEKFPAAEKVITKSCLERAQTQDPVRYRLPEGTAIPTSFLPDSKYRRSLVEVVEARHDDGGYTSLAGAKGGRRTNEDGDLIFEAGSESPITCLSIFDGHGGDEVSKLAQELLAKIIVDKSENTDGCALLYRSYRDLDRKIRLRSRTLAGCTAATVLVQGSNVWSANLGDTHTIVGSISGSRKAEFLTYQPPMAAPSPLAPTTRETQRIESLGDRVVDDQYGIPRINENLNLSRAFGDGYVRSVSKIPSLAFISMPTDDRIILMGCDGLWDYVTPETALQWVRDWIQSDQEISVAHHILERVWMVGERIHGIPNDNITIIVHLPQSVIK